MQAAIDLDKLAEAGSPMPRLLHARRALRRVVSFSWANIGAEVPILAAHQLHSQLAKLKSDLTVAGRAALAGHEPLYATSLVGGVQALDLAHC